MSIKYEICTCGEHYSDYICIGCGEEFCDECAEFLNHNCNKCGGTLFPKWHPGEEEGV